MYCVISVAGKKIFAAQAPKIARRTLQLPPHVPLRMRFRLVNSSYSLSPLIFVLLFSIQ